jgi:cytoskeletal protein CcmA (bactofilin family)
MFEIGKKGGSDRAAEGPGRPDTSSARVEAPAAPRSSASVSREGAVIGPSIHIDGDVRGEEDLLIEGEINGTLQLSNNSLTVGAHGKVHADVYAHSIYVDGTVEGDLYGSERVAIRKSAQVRGNVTSPRVSLEDGAKFKGSIEMDPQAVQSAAASRGMSAPKPTPAPAPAAPKQVPSPQAPPSSVKSGTAS